MHCSVCGHDSPAGAKGDCTCPERSDLGNWDHNYDDGYFDAGENDLATTSDRNTEFDRVNQAHQDGIDRVAKEVAAQLAELKPEAQQRKETPIYSGVIAYFPDAIAEVAKVSFIGNEQHNPGSPLHWDRAKSGDELDACSRHMTDRAKGDKFDNDGARHLGKMAWRALAALQKELEDESQ